MSNFKIQVSSADPLTPLPTPMPPITLGGRPSCST